MKFLLKNLTDTKAFLFSFSLLSVAVSSSHFVSSHVSFFFNAVAICPGFKSWWKLHWEERLAGRFHIWLPNRQHWEAVWEKWTLQWHQGSSATRTRPTTVFTNALFTQPQQGPAHKLLSTRLHARPLFNVIFGTAEDAWQERVRWEWNCSDWMLFNFKNFPQDYFWYTLHLEFHFFLIFFVFSYCLLWEAERERDGAAVSEGMACRAQLMRIGTNLQYFVL